MLYRTKKSGNHLYLALFLYWLILLIWQNIRTAANRDGMDMVIKASLIVLLALYFLYNSQSVKRYVMIVFLLLVSIYAVTKLTAEGFSFDDAMFYFFPLLMFLLTLGMGGKCTVTKKQLTQLCYMLTFAVMYIVVYALIFQPEKYVEAITVTNAYGNELTSFLTSNHEFGYYLSFGVMAAILCGQEETARLLLDAGAQCDFSKPEFQQLLRMGDKNAFELAARLPGAGFETLTPERLEELQNLE